MKTPRHGWFGFLAVLGIACVVAASPSADDPDGAVDTLDVDVPSGGDFAAALDPTSVDTRTFRLGFTSLPPENTEAGWQRGYLALAEHADMVVHSFQSGIPWNEALASSDYRDYPSGVRAAWDILVAANAAVVPDHDVYLMLNPIETARYDRLAPYWGEIENLPLLEPWSSYTFDHPEVKTAYTNFVIAAIETFSPDYVAIGIESNILLAIRPDEWQAYKELNAHTYSTIKGLYPDLTVFTTVHYEHMLALHAESIQLLDDVDDFYPDVLENEVRQLLQHSDLFAVSTYPYMVANNPLIVDDEPVPTYYDRFYAIGEQMSKPLAIDQTGFISRDFFFEPLDVTLPGSPTLQERFITFLLHEAEAHEFRFISNFVGTDYGTNYGTDPTTLTWAWTGLLDIDGVPKPALAAWDSFLTKMYTPPEGEPPPPPALEPLGNVVATNVEEDATAYRLDSGGIARVGLVDRDIVRVRFSVDEELSGWASGAIAPTGLSDPGTTVFDREESTFLVTEALVVIVTKRPFAVVVLRPDGSVVSADTASPIALESSSGLLFNRKIAQPGERFFGLGLRGGPIDRRGGQFVMRNTDSLGYGELDGPLYTSTPFFYGYHDGKFHGLFLDTPAIPIFDMDAAARGAITLGAFQRELDYYVFAGPGPTDVANAYARLTGFAPLPPRWALGFHQSRFSYESWEQVRAVAEAFRSRAIPVDAIHLDLGYMNDLDWFSWDPVDFTDPVGNNQVLESMGVKRVNIIDPSIQPDDPVFGFLETSDFFLENAEGAPVVTRIFEPFGNVAWVDYTNPELGAYYVERLQTFLDSGVSGIWNDLNEPAGSFMPDALYDFGGQNRTDLQARNLYALANVKRSHQAMLEARPDERPFILTRSGYSGIQRYAANWSGDTLSTFDSLRVSVQMSLHMSLSGTVLFGHDIGGFVGTSDPELYTRWVQFAAFTPFMRNHTASPDFTEPWAYGEPYTSIIRDAIERRYRWMPYLYTLVENASRTAVPALRPTFFDFPEDPRTFDRDSELMLGRDVLVAPVFVPGATSRSVYLPAGADWYDIATGARYTGGRELVVPAPLTRIPTFVRAGAILPEGPLKQYVDEPVPPRVGVQLYPRGADGEASFDLYEDDGISFDYRRGERSRTRITATESGSQWTATLARVEVGWTPPDRPWILRFHDVDAPPATVTLDGAPVSEVGSEGELDDVASGWFYRAAEAVLVVRAQQTDLPATVVVQR